MFEIIAAVVGAIIGGFLAAGTGLFLESRKEKRQLTKRLNLFSTAIIDDLHNSISLYEKIKEDWEKSSLIWFVTINEFKKSRQIYERNSDHILLFNTHTLRKRITKYYLKSENIISTLEVLQNKKYFFENKYNQICTDIKIRSPELTDDIIQVEALKITKNDLNEKRWIDDNIPKTIAKLDNLAIEAQALIDKISEKTSN